MMTLEQPGHLPLVALVALASLLGIGCGDAERVGDAAGASSDTVAAVAPTGIGALIDPNSASRDDLMAVPGLDSAAVALILTERPFDDMLAFDRALATRMDSTALDQLYRDVWIPIDLNTASEQEILLIPGVGPRMAHEFEEYRPYEAMAQFRREIGKYVDEDEVARLERYVALR